MSEHLDTLRAVLDGTISGRISEWPQLKPAIAYAVAALTRSEVPAGWISDNDLLKLRDSVDDARNIRMSTKRTHLRVHRVYIPDLAPPPTEPPGGGCD